MEEFVRCGYFVALAVESEREREGELWSGVDRVCRERKMMEVVPSVSEHIGRIRLGDWRMGPQIWSRQKINIFLNILLIYIPKSSLTPGATAYSLWTAVSSLPPPRRLRFCLLR